MSLWTLVSSVILCNSVRERTQEAHWVFHLSQIFTDEQKPFCEQGTPQTSASRRQMAQNVIATFSYNVLWILYAGGLLWVRNYAQKGSVKSVSSVREKTPQRLSRFLSYREGAYYFSQKNTDEQNTQRPTETLSQPNSQNVTAPFSLNALWILYAGGVLWVRNSAQMGSVKSVSSVREKNSPRIKLCAKCSVKSVSSVRKRNTLCERKTSPASCLCVISYEWVRSVSHREHRWAEHTGLIERGLPSLDPCLSPLRVLLFRPPRHCLVAPFLSMQQVFPVVKNHYTSSN